MKLPIQYALTYPDRALPVSDPLTIEKMHLLTFERPDTDTFMCLKAGIQAAKLGGLAPTYLNAANEVAVDLFLKEKIRFLDIGNIAMDALSNVPEKDEYTLQDIFEADRIARERVFQKYNR